MFECESCHLEFDKKATLLRHVSHKKICKEYYGEYRLKDMRIEGELARKRKWWKGHSNEAKQSYQQNKIQIREKNKQKYVKEHVRYETDEGRAFNAFYDFVYDCCKTEAIEKLNKTGVAYDKVYKTASNKATDQVFEDVSTKVWKCGRLILHPRFCEYFPKDADEEDFDEEEYPVEIEKAMEEAFKELVDKQIDIEMEKWMKFALKEIRFNCRSQGAKTAYNLYFQEFCSSMFPSIRDKSLDFAFANFDTDYEGNKIEEVNFQKMLEDKYNFSLEDEARKAGIDSDISQSLTIRLDRKIDKQIRALKEKEYPPIVY